MEIDVRFALNSTPGRQSPHGRHVPAPNPKKERQTCVGILVDDEGERRKSEPKRDSLPMKKTLGGGFVRASWFQVSGFVFQVPNSGFWG